MHQRRDRPSPAVGAGAVLARGPFLGRLRGRSVGLRKEPVEDEEKVLAGHPGANVPALLTKDVPGG